MSGQLFATLAVRLRALRVGLVNTPLRAIFHDNSGPSIERAGARAALDFQGRSSAATHKTSPNGRQKLGPRRRRPNGRRAELKARQPLGATRRTRSPEAVRQN